MRMKPIAIAAFAVLLSAAASVHAQRATERYIPIGQSPGLSARYTYIGPLQAVDPEERTIRIAGDRSVKVTAQTRIWLDRSRLRRTSLSGTFTDLQPGRTIEVKFEDPERREVAEWVKVEVSEP